MTEDLRAAAVALGRKGGQSRTEAKVRAARENARKARAAAEEARRQAPAPSRDGHDSGGDRSGM